MVSDLFLRFPVCVNVRLGVYICFSCFFFGSIFSSLFCSIQLVCFNFIFSMILDLCLSSNERERAGVYAFR